MAASPEIVDVVIIGGGMSGLSAAYELLKKRPQIKLVVLEAKGMPESFDRLIICWCNFFFEGVDK